MLTRACILSVLAMVAVALAPRLAGAAYAQPAQDFSAIAGTWSAHGIALTIADDGRAVAQWRVYTWCTAPGQPAPCDSMNGNQITDGGLATLRFMAMTATTATAIVLTSTDSSFLSPGSTVTLQLMAGGVAQLLTDGDGPILCGPDFDASVFPSSPCGA